MKKPIVIAISVVSGRGKTAITVEKNLNMNHYLNPFI